VLVGSLTRRAEPYANWKRGEKLLASAEYLRLTGDASYAAQVTPTLRRYVEALGAQLGDGLLDRERYSSDIADQVYGLHAQAVVWQSLRAIAADWPDRALAARSRALAARLEPGLRRAVARSQRRLPDGSLFLPVRLLDREPAYEHLTDSRSGSYWNLVAPYALASGLFAPGSAQARGALAYLERHGSRLLGLVRAGAFAVYGPKPPFPVSGTDQVYGINVSRFLADNGEADQLVLSLYGQLAAGMTPGTFVAGEGASVAPLHGLAYRAMYLPPNSTSNGAFLETLRLMLVHETASGLELGFSTPRAWLAPGKRIAVEELPTSFGPLSYSLTAGASSVAVSLDVPPRARTLRLRLRLPHATRTLDLSGRHGHVELRVGVGRGNP
ncbi:MAG TPA: hypothetical protein VLN26_11485, partial [Gaiellaceae bacterium]|nr:hypothetical protein [Gaiellaceae bacterium]